MTKLNIDFFVSIQNTTAPFFYNFPQQRFSWNLKILEWVELALYICFCLFMLN